MYLSRLDVRPTSFLSGLSLVYSASSFLPQWPYLLMCHIKVTCWLYQLERQKAQSSLLSPIVSAMNYTMAFSHSVGENVIFICQLCSMLALATLADCELADCTCS